MTDDNIVELQKEALAAFEKWKKFMGTCPSDEMAAFSAGFAAGKTAGARSILNEIEQITKNAE